jgi:RHS repeat-associated protein
MVLGNQNVQGIDYAYTLQGWLKGVNSTIVGDGSWDMGQDGKAGSSNALVARDVYGYGITYYGASTGASGAALPADYTATGTGVLPFADGSINNTASHRSLFNGNISAMATSIPKLGDTWLNQYFYDQLNRLIETRLFKTLNTTNNSWVPFAGVSDYREAISYDANGNILTYNRKGNPTAGGQLEMDNLYYQYEEDAAGNFASNKLRYVYDGANAANYSEDIDNQTAFGSVNSFNADKKKLLQTSDNYAYDAIGNLTKDAKEGITNIEWTVYGKIKKITKGTTIISYTYDASGNRVSKKVGNVETWYVRDASGNVMAVYSKNAAVNNGYLTQDEVHLYGSSRLGIRKTGRVLDGSLNNGIGKDVVGQEYYELANHLGNVLVTISDKRVGVDADNNGQVDYYTAVIMSAQDYYAFGMIKPGRKYNVDGYRYGFNGKEKSDEISGQGVDYDYGFRIYDARVGRFLSVDPLSKEYPWNSTYAFAENDVIRSIDLDGLEKLIVVEYYDKDNNKTKTVFLGIRDSKTKEAVNMNMKSALNVKLTTQDVYVIRLNHKGKIVFEGPGGKLDKYYKKIIRKAPTDSNTENDPNLPAKAMQQTFTTTRGRFVESDQFNSDENEFFERTIFHPKPKKPDPVPPKPVAEDPPILQTSTVKRTSQIKFEGDDNTPIGEYSNEINSIVSTVKSQNVVDYSVTILGNTDGFRLFSDFDSHCSDTYHKGFTTKGKLADARANKIKELLVRAGLDASKIVTDRGLPYKGMYVDYNITTIEKKNK